MIPITITVSATDAIRRIGAASGKMDKGIERAVRKGAFLVERVAKQYSPVDTGRMRSSIFSDVYPFEATIQPNVDYAIFVHEGTRNMRGRPFMKDAERTTKSQIEDIFNDEIDSAVKSI